jgi:hypothetical protein
MLGPGQIGAQLGEHAPAGFDRRELMLIADQDGFGAGPRGGGQLVEEIAGADHGGLVNDHQSLRFQL